MSKRIHRKIKRTPAELDRIKAVRSKFQSQKPSLDELVESGEYTEPMLQGEYLERRAIAHALKEAREAAGLSLADVAAATGIDRSQVSRLENGIVPNTTVSTLDRLARAYGKHFEFRLVPDCERVNG